MKFVKNTSEKMESFQEVALIYVKKIGKRSLILIYLLTGFNMCDCNSTGGCYKCKPNEYYFVDWKKLSWWNKFKRIMLAKITIKVEI